MEFENEDWKLIITPKYIRKDTEKIAVPCRYCDGSGHEQDPDSMGFYSESPICWYCHGSGQVKEYKKIPPPPDMDAKFLKDLKEWFQNYRPKDV